jgi:type III pantothenate kinase
MDINLLVINVGNSRVALGVFDAGDLVYASRMALDDQPNWEGRLAEAWSRIKAKPDAAVVGASVNPAVTSPIERAIMAATGQKLEWVGQDIDFPAKVMTEKPSETGVDRIVNIAAAFEQMQKACVVVDAGTAITVDVCNDKGEFLGGAIAPGVEMQLQALGKGTAQLPEVEFEPPAGPIGRNTRQAILDGIYYGIRGMVKELVENYATELGFWPEIIATGGDSAKLFEGWELVHAIAPDLTLYGIALAYANHHIKHGT